MLQRAKLIEELVFRPDGGKHDDPGRTLLCCKVKDLVDQLRLADAVDVDHQHVVASEGLREPAAGEPAGEPPADLADAGAFSRRS